MLTDFIQYHSHASSSSQLWLSSPVFIAFSQKEMRIQPFSAALETQDCAMQRAGEHHALALQTPPETEHFVARNQKINSIKKPSKNQAEGGLSVLTWGEQKTKI